MIVVFIIGIIGAIAIPRVSSSAENAAKNATIGDCSALQSALDLYEAEHHGTMAHVGAANLKEFYYRLLKHSDFDGTVNDTTGIYGPYINGIPVNKINGIAEIRIDGAAAGADTHGWRYNSDTGQIEPDHLLTAKGHKANGKTVKAVTAKVTKGLGG